jgi:small subunit ribosomal protein S8
MNVTDPIGDLLARIRNAQQRGKSKVTTPASKLRERVLEVLQQEGYIRGFAVAEHDGGKAEIEIELKYFDGEPVIKKIERVSKPGRRVYSSVKDCCRWCINGLGISIVSTSKGVMSDTEARAQNVGGEVLCKVF